MRPLKRHVLVTVLFASTAAFSAPASEDSIRQLLAVTKMRSTLDGIQSQLKEMMHGIVQQALGGKIPTLDQQEAIDRMENKLLAIVQRELSWEKREPMYIHLYQELFTEEEIAGMLSFYGTPAGQAVVNKMPTLMQRSMLEMQEMQRKLGPEIRRIQQEFISELRAADK
jgi:uncharacterized protein